MNTFYTKHRNWFDESLVMLEIFSLVNISNITRLSCNQFRSFSVKSVHKRITMFIKQGQGKNKQMFVVNKNLVVTFQQ